MKARRLRKHVVVVTQVLQMKSITPLAAYEALANGKPSALMESLRGREYIGASIVAVDPYLRFIAVGNESRAESLDKNIPSSKSNVDPLKHLRKLLRQYSPMKTPGSPKYIGGAIGAFGSVAISLTEPTITPNAVDDLGVPDIYLYFYKKVLLFDHKNGLIYITVNVPVNGDLEYLYAQAVNQIQTIKEALEMIRETPRPEFVRLKTGPITSNMTKEQFMVMVDRAKEYIRNGDIFQVVVSQRFECSLYDSSIAFYDNLRMLNPSPYMFHMDFGGGLKLVGASPEVMVRIENGEILIRPLAGTRRRGKTAEEDAAIAFELRNDPKEIAEHSMLLDLARNDVGKASEPGTVRVGKMLAVEPYGAVLHIVSDVEGPMRKNLCPLDVLFIGYPAGTLSGAPKVRASQIFNELEPARRGFYGGAIGWLTDTDMDTCIVIRSATIIGEKVYFQTGSGIVADSDPESEHDESMAKSLSIRKALGGGA